MYMFYNKRLMPQRLIKKGGKWYEAVRQGWLLILQDFGVPPLFSWDLRSSGILRGVGW